MSAHADRAKANGDLRAEFETWRKQRFPAPASSTKGLYYSEADLLAAWVAAAEKYRTAALESPS